MVDFTTTPLIPAIAQDATTGQVLMVAYMNQESLRLTLESGDAWFWSRSRRELWHKGETSGNFLHVRSVTADCDGDTILLKVDPDGPACHTGEVSCFFNDVSPDNANTPVEGQTAGSGESLTHPMDELFATILERKTKQPEGSYVAGLLNEGTNRVAKKVIEEAGETALASVAETDERFISETADLWFHSLILLASRGLQPSDVWDELERRRR